MEKKTVWKRYKKEMEVSMNITTKLFGEIEVDENKVITFPSGLIGFEDCKRFMIMHDEEVEEVKIMWLQSVDEPGFALPIVNPLRVCPDYNPVVEDELFKCIGESEEEMLVLVTMSVPSDVTKTAVNLKAPLVVNPTTKKACQIIVENDEYPIRYPIYNILNQKGED
jgi:flagellar assembly factor FliW